MKDKALLIAILDVSGSMGYTKRKYANSYYSALKSGLILKYSSIEERFIEHTTVAKEVNSEYELFNSMKNGGTYISSGLEIAKDIISEKDNSEDVYVVNFSDGDNWGEDNDEAVNLMKYISRVSNYRFVEIKTSQYCSTITSDILDADESINVVRIYNEEDLKENCDSLLDIEYSQVNADTFDGIALLNKEDVKSVRSIGNKVVVTLNSGAVGEVVKENNDKNSIEFETKAAYLKAKIIEVENNLQSLINEEKNKVKWDKQWRESKTKDVFFKVGKVNGKETCVKVKVKGERGYSRCSEEDVFNLEKGIKIATLRALLKMCNKKLEKLIK